MEDSPKGSLDLRAASSSGLCPVACEGISVWFEKNFSGSTGGSPGEEERDQVSSVNGEEGAGSLGRQGMGNSETKGSKALYNVGESFMALFMS